MKKIWITLMTVTCLLWVAALPALAQDVADDRVLIYHETFDYEDQTDMTAVLETIEWVVQNKADDAYADASARLSISGGRLQIDNTGGNDSYYLILDETYMSPYSKQTLTIQYDMEYTTAANASRYFCMLANYAGGRYNSFHFRNSGSANNQVHFDGGWFTYDAYRAETDLFAAATDGNTGTSIAKRLLGVTYNSGKMAFANVPVTVRYVLHATEGPYVYMKLADQGDDAFVCVSQPDTTAAIDKYHSWDANAIAFKVGGAQNGYVDNIAVWTGEGNMPAVEPEEEQPAETETAEPSTDDPETVEPDAPGETEEEQTTEEQPAIEQTREPHTIVGKAALCAVALFGGWVILKKEKENRT